MNKDGLDRINNLLTEKYSKRVGISNQMAISSLLYEYKKQKIKLDKIKEIMTPTPENPTSCEFQMCDEYRKIEEILEK